MKRGQWVQIAIDDEALYCECGGICGDDMFCTKCRECVDPYDESEEDLYI